MSEAQRMSALKIEAYLASDTGKKIGFYEAINCTLAHMATTHLTSSQNGPQLLGSRYFRVTISFRVIKYKRKYSIP